MPEWQAWATECHLDRTLRAAAEEGFETPRINFTLTSKQPRLTLKVEFLL
jgi:hypothetical protein